MTMLLKLCFFPAGSQFSLFIRFLRRFFPLGQIYILLTLDINNNFAEMAWNSPKRVNFSRECNGPKAPIMNHVWSGNRENQSPSSFKSDTTNLGNISIAVIIEINSLSLLTMT